METNRSTLMLKYQKAVVKLLEFGIPKKQWPSFPLNYRDLAYPTVWIISQCAEAINGDVDNEVAFNNLRSCAAFYDAAYQSREQQIHDVEFALTGAAAYFFLDDFGSAKVLWQTIDYESIIDDYQKCLYQLFELAFIGKVHGKKKYKIVKVLEEFLKLRNRDVLSQAVGEFRDAYLATSSPQVWFWAEIICAVEKIISEVSARILLPQFSALDDSRWDQYFSTKKSVHLLWASQRLVGESRILQGKNAIVQLPTGVGKTKGIELIVWSLFLSERGSKALIVAPLRSLCNEITLDLRSSFPTQIVINQFTDVLEEDFIGVLKHNDEKQILVCTPEKLQYILYHDISFFDAIDLYIFDESHMFDDSSRGAQYELLMTDIKMRKKDHQQIILMSAVLPNSDQIVKWLFGNEGVLAYDANIQSTPKNVGFADKNRQLHYYSSLDVEEDYFVPYTYNQHKLKLFVRERKERVFPDTPQDIALYYANTLCKYGGVAIFCAKRKSILSVHERIEELNQRGYTFDRIREESDIIELSRFKALYESYYGENHIYTKTIQYGILPHYSSLPNGIKIATEYAFKKNRIRAVACTSTLAQGVNIPIKHLLITSTSYASARMSVRSFQNLIGRTGRSGFYTEGDIVVTDNKIFDERDQRGKGYYKWKDTRALFNEKKVEACGSSILNIVRDFCIAYNVIIIGSEVLEIVINQIDGNWTDQLFSYIANRIQQAIKSTNIDKYKKEIQWCVTIYEDIINTIENELIYHCLLHSSPDSADALHESSVNLLENTLAYYLASNEEKKLLGRLFDAIETKVEGQLGNIQRYSGIMVSMADADRILQWIDNNRINTDAWSAIDLVDSIEKLGCELFPELDLIDGLSLSWIRGDSYDQMSNDYGVDTYKVEKYCQQISYHTSFLIGTIIDLIDADCVNRELLLLLQREMRYGVSTKTAVSVCERVFNERLLANEISFIVGDSEISTTNIIKAIKANREEILSLLNRYPTYFEDVVLGL